MMTKLEAELNKYEHELSTLNDIADCIWKKQALVRWRLSTIKKMTHDGKTEEQILESVRLLGLD